MSQSCDSCGCIHGGMRRDRLCYDCGDRSDAHGKSEEMQILGFKSAIAKYKKTILSLKKEIELLKEK